MQYLLILLTFLSIQSSTKTDSNFNLSKMANSIQQLIPTTFLSNNSNIPDEINHKNTKEAVKKGKKSQIFSRLTDTDKTEAKKFMKEDKKVHQEANNAIKQASNIRKNISEQQATIEDDKKRIQAENGGKTPKEAVRQNYMKAIELQKAMSKHSQAAATLKEMNEVLASM